MIIELAVITIGSFLAALVNAMFATGGIHLLLGASTAVLLVAVAMPLQSVLAMSSLVALRLLAIGFAPTRFIGAL